MSKRATVAEDQDRDRGLGRPFAQAFDQGHGRRGADHLVEGDASAGPLLQCLSMQAM